MPNINDVIVSATVNTPTQEVSLVSYAGETYTFAVVRPGQPSWQNHPPYSLSHTRHTYRVHVVDNIAVRDLLTPNFHDYALFTSGRVDVYDGQSWFSIKGADNAEGEFVIVPAWAAGAYQEGDVVQAHGFLFKANGDTSDGPTAGDANGGGAWSAVTAADLFRGQTTSAAPCTPPDPGPLTYDLQPLGPQTAYLCEEPDAFILNQMSTSLSYSIAPAAHQECIGHRGLDLVVVGWYTNQDDDEQRVLLIYDGFPTDGSGPSSVISIYTKPIYAVDFINGETDHVMITDYTTYNYRVPLATANDINTWQYQNFMAYMSCFGGHPTPGKVLAASNGVYNATLSRYAYDANKQMQNEVVYGDIYPATTDWLTNPIGCWVDREGYASLYTADVGGGNERVWSYWSDGNLRTISRLTPAEIAYFDLNKITSDSVGQLVKANAGAYVLPADIEYTCPRIKYSPISMFPIDYTYMSSTIQSMDVSDSGWYTFCEDNQIHILIGNFPSYTDGGPVLDMTGIVDTPNKRMAIIDGNLIVHSSRPGHEGGYVTVMQGITTNVDYEFNIQSLAGTVSPVDDSITGLAAVGRNLVVRTPDNCYSLTVDGGSATLNKSSTFGGTEPISRGDRIGVLYIDSGTQKELSHRTLTYEGYDSSTAGESPNFVTTNGIDMRVSYVPPYLRWREVTSFFDNPEEP